MKEVEPKSKNPVLSEKNLEFLNLLLSQDSFSRDVVAFREKYPIEIPRGFIIRNEEDSKQIFEALNELETLMGKFRVSEALGGYLWQYITHGTLQAPMSLEEDASKSLESGNTLEQGSYLIRVEPPVEIGKSGHVIRYAKSVSLITHQRLTTVEKKKALKELEIWQKKALHPSTTRRHRVSPSLERNLSVEKEMSTRERPYIEVEYAPGSYLDFAYKNTQRGSMTPEEFKHVEKKHSNDVRKIKKGKTSKDVAQKILGSERKGDSVRQTASRLKKKRRELFE